MSALRLHFHFRVDRALYRSGFFLLVFGVAVPQLSSENVTLTSYYPAPSGVYKTIVAAADSYLATAPLTGILINGGTGAAGATPKATLDVRGGIKATINMTSTRGAGAASCGAVQTSGGTAACGAGQYRTFLPGALSAWDNLLDEAGTKYFCCTCPSPLPVLLGDCAAVAGIP